MGVGHSVTGIFFLITQGGKHEPTFLATFFATFQTGASCPQLTEGMKQLKRRPDVWP